MTNQNAGLANLAGSMESLKELLEYNFISFGNIKISLFSVIMVVLIFLIVHLILRTVRFVLKRLTSKNKDFDQAKIYTIIQLLKYVLYLIAIVLVLDNLGFDINSLLIGSAAFLAAIGLGLQPIFHDMVSGIVIFFEGVMHKGDVLEVDNMVVKVEEINLRTSKVMTRDGNFLIIPNGTLTSNHVVNWSHQNELSRLMIQVGVAYGSDTKLVEQLLIKCAKEHKQTVNPQNCSVWFVDFGDSALVFQLFFWTRKTWDSEVYKSEIRFEIDRVFRENGIKIPFPQRDVHLYKTI